MKGTGRRKTQAGEDGEGYDDPGPIETFRCDRIPPREQDREYDQHGHGADVNKYLDESDKLRPQKEIEGGDTDKCHGQTEGSMNEFGERGGCNGGGESQNGDDNEGGAVHSAKR